MYSFIERKPDNNCQYHVQHNSSYYQPQPTTNSLYYQPQPAKYNQRLQYRPDRRT